VLLEDLHAQLLAGDNQAAEVICGGVLKELPRLVRIAIPAADPHVIGASVDDTLMAYLESPTRFDPRRGSLVRWLTQCAINRVRDAMRSGRRRLAHETPVGVDLASIAAGITGPEVEQERTQWIQEHRQEFLAVAKTSRELAFLQARLDGAELLTQAAALGLAQMTPQEQRQQVGRIWDLLCRRFRWRRRHPHCRRP